jgi:receptor-type tyrosine-protein phosphatase gamma
VDKCEDLKSLEKAIPLSKFEEESLNERDPEMEFRILSRINCHKIHYKNLFKSQNIDFKRKNRYNEVLPFTHSMVKIQSHSTEERYGHYINACYINVCIFYDNELYRLK